MFLGSGESSNEYLVGTTSFVFTTCSIRRQPERERWDRGILEALKGHPWQLTPSDEIAADILPACIGIKVRDPETRVVRPDVAETNPVPRRTRIRATVELKKCGCTPKCDGCDAARAGRRAHLGRERLGPGVEDGASLTTTLKKAWLLTH